MRRIFGILLLALLAIPAGAQVFTVASGQSKVFGVNGNRYFTVQTVPGSAASVLTFSGNSSDGDTFTIGSTVYTTESSAIDVAFEVKTAGTAALYIVNLCAAINAGSGVGTLYATGTTAHPTVTCSASNATTLTVTAILPGSNANAIATSTTSGTAAWTGSTLVDVTDPVVTLSRVDSSSATTHTAFQSTVTDTEPALDIFIVDWPFLLVTATGGDAEVAVAP